MNPHLWLLLGQKAGDNNQLLALAEALAWPWEEKRIYARSWEILPHLLLGPNLLGIDRRRSSPLEPPWPELILTAGRRNEPVARWIQRQSGGRTRLVHMGRPWAPLDCFDLIVTTPQYFLPEQANILHNRLPLHRINPARVKAQARRLEPELVDLPGPYTTVLIGGDSGPFVFTPEKARQMAQAVNQLQRQTGGSLLVSDSPRTPKTASEAFRKALEGPAHSYWWHRDAPHKPNPYLDYLGWADRFVVSGESMSMIAEAGAMDRPVYLFDPGDDSPQWWRYRHNFRHKPLSHHLAMHLAPRRMRRDVGRIQQALVAQGRACWLTEAPELVAGGESWFRSAPDSDNEAERAAAKIRSIMQQPFNPSKGETP